MTTTNDETANNNNISLNTIDEIMDMWKKDSKIEISNLGLEQTKTGMLHSKYSRMLAEHSLRVKKLGQDYKKLLKLKWLYYSGKLNGTEELVKYGWEPFPFTLKSDMNIFLDGDQDLSNILIKKSYHEEVVYFCVGIIKELNNRTWALKSAIDYERYMGGN